MRLPDQTSPLKNDLRDRSLRSSSPAIKRPASDMGAQDREDHVQDVDMHDQPATPTTATDADLDTNGSVNQVNQGNRQTNNLGKRQKNDSHSSTLSPSIHSFPPGLIDSVTPISGTGMTSSAPGSELASTAMTDDHSKADIPSIDDQVKRVFRMTQQKPLDGEKGYIVSMKWLKKVAARCTDPPPGIPVDKSALEEAIGPVSNADLVLVIDQSDNLRDEAGEPFTALKPTLQPGEDYLVVPSEVWELIIQWYGLDQESPAIVRYAHALSEDDPNEIQYELNPPVFTFLKVVGTHTQQTERDANLPPPRMVASVHKPFMKWLKDAKELVHCNIDTKVRVWKIITGLKSASASGILTPIASRSASPAPGAEIIASAGSKMILDVNTFSLLSLGDQRERVEQKDQTMNTNYNGSIDLKTLGMGRSDVIVLEEETSKADEYPSESPRLSLKGGPKSKNLTVSGRSSPAPGGIMTRGRAQKEGRPKGIVGLSNLGNTCYMNSALQCIRSVEELTDFFRSKQWHKEVNYDNPLGNHGEIAKAYGHFIEAVYATNSGSHSPNAFKRVVGKYGSQFAGYGQQDSQEFLAFLLDGLSEDLNRIHKKPYVEKPDSTDEMVHDQGLLKNFADRNWSDFKARNDSVIIDLFAGMYKSTLTCPSCDKVSIVFDPFTTLTMQLPIENNWSKEIVYFPVSSRPYRIDIDIDKHASILDLKKFVAARTHYDPQKMMCAESYKNRVFKVFDNNEMISEANISANDVVCLYELSEKPTNYNADKKKKFSQFSYGNKDGDPKVDAKSPAADQLLTTVFHRVSRMDRYDKATMNFFGHPTFVVLSRDDRRSYESVMKKLLVHIKGMTTRDFLNEDDDILDKEKSGDDSDTLLLSSTDEDTNSHGASAVSVQGEDGLVDVSMNDASPSEENVNGQAGVRKLMRARRVPKQFLSLFDAKLAMTDDGIPQGWNTLNENGSYPSLRERAANLQSMNERKARQSIDDEAYDSGSSDVVTEQDDSSKSNDSEAEDPVIETLPVEDDLPELEDIPSGKDTRGMKKHEKKKTYSRKGKKIIGKPSRKASSPVISSAHHHENAVPTDLVMSGEGIILDWTPESYEAFFGAELGQTDQLRGMLTHEELELFEDSELIAKRSVRVDRKKNGVTLEDCLSEFQKTETLSEQNAWYCPRCKEHRRADKQFELWKAPDILVMHLKRFASTRDFRNKLDVKVEYPVEGLDLSTMVRDHSDGKSLIYDLIAVDLHYGGLGGGHYTATAKNAVNQKWYEYNDSHASQVKDTEGGVVSKHAYLLFYRRRAEPPLGGPKLAEILMQAESEDASQSRDGSPSGEGQRLGDSSHNGSSSAGDQLHRVGGGGLANQQKSNLSQSLNYQGETHEIFHTDDEPPAYNTASDDMLLSEDVGIGSHDQGWSFEGIGAAAPPTSENGDMDPDFTKALFSYKPPSNGSGASSTAGFAGSTGNVSDSDNDPIHSFIGPEAENDRNTTGSEQGFSTFRMGEEPTHIPFGGQGVQQEDDEDLEVQELRIAGSPQP